MSGLVTTGGTNPAPLVKSDSRQKQAKSKTKAKAQSLVESSFEAGYKSAEAETAGRAYVAGVGLRVHEIAAEGIGRMVAIMQDGGLVSGIDDAVLDAAIASLAPASDVGDWGELL
jgi:hypothetical protein